MNEAEWLAWADPCPMITFLRYQASDRKLRLFAVGCCRRIWRLLRDGPERDLVILAEEFADGLVRMARLEDLGRRVREAGKGVEYERRQAVTAAVKAAQVDYEGASNHAVVAAAYDITNVKPPYGESTLAPWRAAVFDENTAQATLLRDIFGNPFRSPPSLDRAWLAWDDGAVRKLAQVIYDDRAFDRLPLLADALEDAGCTNAAILGHCRGPGEHVRGCWVVDLLLDKS